MHTLIRAAMIALPFQQVAGVTAELAAQGAGGSARSARPACPLVTEKEVESATGLDFGPGEDHDERDGGMDDSPTCLWGGWSMARELPEIHVVFVPASARGSLTERRLKQQLRPACTREPVRGVGDRAFAEVCKGPIPSASVYASTGTDDVVVRVYQPSKAMTMAPTAKSVAIVLARAAAARAKGT